LTNSTCRDGGPRKSVFGLNFGPERPDINLTGARGGHTSGCAVKGEQFDAATVRESFHDRFPDALEVRAAGTGSQSVNVHAWLE
jgi:hypothetical protein